jgi:hypothetical protein
VYRTALYTLAADGSPCEFDGMCKRLPWAVSVLHST